MSVHIDTLATTVAAAAPSLPSVSNDIDPDTSSDSNSGSNSPPPQSSMDLNDHAAHHQQPSQQQPQQDQHQHQHQHQHQQHQHQQHQHQQHQHQHQHQQQQQHQQHHQQHQHGLSHDMGIGGGVGGQHPQQHAQQQSGAMGGGGYPSRRVTIGGSNHRNSLGFDMGLGMRDFFDRRPSGFGDIDILGRRNSLDSTTAVLDAAIRDLTSRRLSLTGGPGGVDGGLGMAGGPGGAGMGDPMSGMGGMGSMGSMGSIGGMGSMGSMGAMNSMNNSMGAGPGVGSMGNVLNSASASNSAPPSLLSPNQNSVERIAQRQNQLQEQARELERRQKELELERQRILAGMEERKRAMQQMQMEMQRNVGGMSINTLHMMGSPTGGHNNIYMNRANAAATLPPQSPGSGWIVCQFCNKKAFASQEEAYDHEDMCSRSNGPARHMAQRNDSLGFGFGNFRDDAGYTGMGMGMSMGMGMGMGVRGGPLQRAHSRFPSMAGLSEEMPPPPLYQAGQSGTNNMPSVNFRDFSGNNEDVGSSSPGGNITLSTGPFATMEKPLPLAMPSDKDWLTPLHCFVRRHCVELFTASEKDVQTPSKGKRKPIQVGQVGIRCPHCHPDSGAKARERGSVYYPTTIASIYNATMNLLQRHLHNCTSVPSEIMQRYETLKADDARSGTSKKYWIESALSLGLVDTANGIRFSAESPPALPTLSDEQRTTGDHKTVRRDSNEFFSSDSNAAGEGNDDDDHVGSSEREYSSGVARRPSLSSSSPGPSASAPVMSGDSEHGLNPSKPVPPSTPLVTPDDEPYSTAFSYQLLSQMQPCVFTEADRLGKRKGLPPGFPGLACRHCFGGYGSGRFFPSSIKTLSDTSKTLNVLHNHMMRCRKCPTDVRETLTKLRSSHDEERAKMKFGSQKAFFTRVWNRLHKDDDFGSDFRETSSAKRKYSSIGLGNPPPSAAYPLPHQHPHPMMGGPMGMGPMSSARMPPLSASGMYGGHHPHSMMDAMGMSAARMPPLDHDRLGMMDMDAHQGGMQRGGDQKRKRES